MASTQTWLPTDKAAAVLGIKPATLKRAYGHPETGFLREGKHWKGGMYRNSPKAWCIEECKAELANRGYVFLGRIEVLDPRATTINA